MEVEDVPDKARRNLMFVATGVIAVWALGIPLDGKLIGVIDIKSVQPWRAWACALLVLAYCYARYHYAPSTGHGLSEWRTVRKKMRARLIEDLVKTAIIKTLEGVPQNRVSIKYEHEPTDGYRYMRIVPGDESAFDRWKGEVRIHWAPLEIQTVKPSIEVMKKMGNFGQFGFAVNICPRAQSEIAIWRHSLRLGWTTLEFLLPYPLAVFAAGIAFYHLAIDLKDTYKIQWLPAW